MSPASLTCEGRFSAWLKMKGWQMEPSTGPRIDQMKGSVQTEMVEKAVKHISRDIEEDIVKDTAEDAAENTVS